ncbi:hypothetical protein [Arthrobacter sp. 18067]|uniref:hypothetical protein n=1 Tax=Arthrobacter sp. 18067 TaxID=2681413 RepID=UPI00135B806D|nr:hypothetical protein [Arthrobacter sp. 18067]
MYEAANADPSRESTRQRHLAAADDFGEFATSISRPNQTMISVSGPAQTGHGMAVVTHISEAGRVAGPPSAAQCFVTLKPAPHFRVQTAAVLNVLTAELSDFALRQLLASYEDGIVEVLNGVSAQPSTLQINGVSITAWSQEARGVRGRIAGYQDRLIMWLGAGNHQAPPSLITRDLGSHLRKISAD